jgi:hypothetical protein
MEKSADRPFGKYKYPTGWTQGCADSVRKSGANNIQRRHNQARGRFLSAINLPKKF